MAAPIIQLKNKGSMSLSGETLIILELVIQKTYKDKATGAYKETKYLFENELPTLISMLQEAQTWIATNRTTGEDVRNVMGANFNVTSDDDIDDLPF